MVEAEMDTIEKNETGFTLIEVVIAMAILSIGILAIISIQYHVVNGNTNANVVTQEMYLGQLVLERLKNRDTPSGLTASSLTGVDMEGNTPGPYNAVVQVFNPLGGDTSRFITVTVTKTGGVGGHPLVLHSLTQGNGI